MVKPESALQTTLFLIELFAYWVGDGWPYIFWCPVTPKQFELIIWFVMRPDKKISYLQQFQNNMIGSKATCGLINWRYSNRKMLDIAYCFFVFISVKQFGLLWHKGWASVSVVELAKQGSPKRGANAQFDILAFIWPWTSECHGWPFFLQKRSYLLNLTC